MFAEVAFIENEVTFFLRITEKVQRNITLL